jgi:N-methylhydantoinase B
MTLRKGQVFRHELPGAGAWGDALSRDLTAVGQDLRDGLVSIEGAERDYGVVAAGDPPVIDAAATEGLRAELRASRPKLPEVAWEPAYLNADSSRGAPPPTSAVKAGRASGR